MTDPKTVDLMAALEEIETLAKHTQLNLAAGLASSGVTGLKKIQDRASDARRWASTPTPEEESIHA